MGKHEISEAVSCLKKILSTFRFFLKKNTALILFKRLFYCDAEWISAEKTDVNYLISCAFLQ